LNVELEDGLSAERGESNRNTDNGPSSVPVSSNRAD